MKIKPSPIRLAVLAAVALLAPRLAAQTLAADTAVFLQTDPKSPVITRLKAGTVVKPAGEAPTGWQRVEVDGPFEAYVQNRDMTKGLDVRAGANIYTAPRKDAPVMTVATKDDKTTITGLHGDWAQIRLEKRVQGFIAVGATANTPAEVKPLPPVVASPAPVANPAAPGRPVPLIGDTAGLPRLFAGKLVSARRPFINPNPPYDYQLIDNSGRRCAYVDTKRLVMTDKIDALVDREVTITGTVRNTVDGKDLVIAAESMQVK
ncbi:MAG TPA: SH3 domain-containing protein [Lacunisphaera sp.]|nr:SH3 domain-containing protein [Lacunisphaera sp.]